jgi:hypothetical protein
MFGGAAKNREVAVKQLSSRAMITLALAASAMAQHAAAASFTDGTFTEAATVGAFSTVAGGHPLAPSSPWTVTGNDVDLLGTFATPPSGSVGSVDLNGSAPGGIAQTFTAPAGAYVVSFALSGNPGDGPTIKMLTVSASGGATASQDYTFDVTGNFSKNTVPGFFFALKYATETFDFVSNGTTPITLSFTGVNPGDAGPIVGDISLASVPEPETWALLLVGVGCIGGLRRFRRRGHGADRGVSSLSSIGLR